MIFASSNFGAGCIKDSRDQKLKKTSAYSISLRLCVKNLWDGSERNLRLLLDGTLSKFPLAWA